MITAQEAKKLYDDSGHQSEVFLKTEVEPKVTAAAKEGKLSVIVYLGTFRTIGHFQGEVKPLQKAVVQKLLGLGYRAEIKPYGDPYIPMGLKDLDGNGPQHQNFGIHIHW